MRAIPIFGGVWRVPLGEDWWCILDSFGKFSENGDDDGK